MYAVGNNLSVCNRRKLNMLFVICIGIQLLSVATASPKRYVKNMNFPSQCTEEDNVNMPIYGGFVSDYKITATFPTYYPLEANQADLCTTDYTHCEQSWDMRPTAQIAYYHAAEQKLKFAWQSPGYYWYPIETPDETNRNVGQYVSLAYPPTNRHGVGLGAPPAMVYYDASNKRLLYIVRDLWGKWSEPETVDASGNVGPYAALRISRDRQHHVVYYDALNRDLKYTYKADPGAIDGWQSPMVLDAPGDVGQHAAMAIGPANTLHVVYYDATDTALKYIEHDHQTKWSKPVVLDAAGEVGQYATISVYYEGRQEKMAGAYEGRYPHVAYYDASHGQLKYIYKDAHGWSTPVVLDAEGNVGQYASMVFGPDGSLHLAYYDATRKDLKYLYKAATSSNWSSPKVLDANGDVGKFASLGVAARGYPNIAYYDADHQQLKFLSITKNTAPHWGVARIISSKGAGQYASLVMSGFIDDVDQTGVELYDDGDVRVVAVGVPGWPFASGMSVAVAGGTSTPNHDYIRIHKRADHQHDPPQVFVLYANGYARMIPQPPVWREDRVCFGASVILGPAVEDPLYPISMIDSLNIDPHQMRVNVKYENGSAAIIHIQAERGKTMLQVTDVTYDTATVPFVTLRSMWVTDDNSDIAKVTAVLDSGSVQTHSMDPQREEWTTLPSDAWYFHRPTYSRHNTSSPDFKIEVLGPKGYLVTKQAEDYHTGTLTKTERQTASGGYTVGGTGEATYALNLMEDIPSAVIRLRYSKSGSGRDMVRVYVDGVKRAVIGIDESGASGDYGVTHAVSLEAAIPAGRHSVKLDVQSPTGALELDYFVMHNQTEGQSP